MAKLEGITPVCSASWAKINNMVDVYENNGTTKRTYQINGHFPNEKEEAAFIAQIEEAFAEFKASDACKGKKFDDRFPASLGFFKDKDGKTQFKFWTFSEYPATDDKPETKKIVPVQVLNVGALGEKNIGNGSEVQIKYQLKPFYSSAKGFGVSLILLKVLVRKLVEFGGGAEDWSEFGVDADGGSQPGEGEDFSF